MRTQENQKLANIAYVNSQIALSLIELEAMKSDNQMAEHQGYSPAWSYAEFMKLVDKYQLGHNDVVTNLNK